MRLDADLFRKLLLAIEASTDTVTMDGIPMAWSRSLFVDGYPPPVHEYHVQLLKKCDHTYAFDMSTADRSGFVVALSRKGRQFVDVARDDDRWEEAKRLVLEKLGDANNFTFTEIVLEKLAKDSLLS